MFGRKKSTESTVLNPETFLRKFVQHHVDTEMMKENARSCEQNIAILKPQIPLGIGKSVGWLGGHPELPAGTTWPERDGKKLLFAAQFDLSALPVDLWSGIGPRTGSIAIFLPAEFPVTPIVLHFDGPLVEMQGPQHRNTDWTRSETLKRVGTYHLPKWPLVVEKRAGSSLHEDEGIASCAPKSSPACLVDRAYHPFDRDTLLLLMESLGEAVISRAKTVFRFPAMKKLREADAEWFKRQQPIALDTFHRFFEIEGALQRNYLSSPDQIADAITQLSTLRTYDFEYKRDDDEGFCELELRDTKFLEAHSGTSELLSWWHTYESGLNAFAIKAYTQNLAKLPFDFSSRMEKHWRMEAANGLAIMGHAPQGHIYTEHGPDSPNEVLLEIFTSKLVGWIWGDCYSLVILINREALRRGDFSNLLTDITN